MAHRALYRKGLPIPGLECKNSLVLFFYTKKQCICRKNYYSDFLNPLMFVARFVLYSVLFQSPLTLGQDLCLC